jgi:GTP cyclohydrolase I
MPTTAIAGNDINFRSNLSKEAQLVRNALIERGLETPMSGVQLSRDEKYARIRDAMTQVVTALGLDLTDDSLEETPHRIAKMYVDEIFSGLNYEKFPKISLIQNKMNTEEMVKVKAIKVISTCEHHFVTIDGLANVAYLPGKKIIGLSKINRIVAFFCSTPSGPGAIDSAGFSCPSNSTGNRRCCSFHRCNTLLRKSQRNNGCLLKN